MDAFLSEAIEVRRGDRLEALDSKVIESLLIRRDEKYVGSRLRH